MRTRSLLLCAPLLGAGWRHRNPLCAHSLPAGAAARSLSMCIDAAPPCQQPRLQRVGFAKGVAPARRPMYTRAPAVHLRSPFTVLGIETSCDDTGVAVVRSDGLILGEALTSQAALHEEWGGVVPGIARDAHEQALGATIELAVARAGLSSVADVDAVAVTAGPGLEICLRVGAEAAKALAAAHSKPFVAVHHLEAHVLMARLACDPPPQFPFLTLLVSGGHCQLLLSRALGDHRVIGGTLDDALGEAYDKVARLLELPVGDGHLGSALHLGYT